MTELPLNEMMKTARLAKRLSLGLMAQRVHFSKGYLSNVEAGRKPVTPELLIAYEDVLGIELGGSAVKRRAIVAALSAGVVSPDAVTEVVRHGLMSAAGKRPTVTDWEEIVEEHGRAYLVTHPRLLSRRLAGDLALIRPELDDGSPPLWAACARLLTLYAAVLIDTGDFTRRWWRTAGIAAKESQDKSLQQWVRGREAFRAGYEGLPPVKVLDLARDVDAPEAHLAAAQAWARLVEHSNAERSLTAAWQSWDALRDQTEETIYHLPAWRIVGASGYIAACAGDVARASASLPDIPSSATRFTAQTELQTALAEVMAGDKKSGVARMEAVLSGLTPETRTTAILRLADEVRHAARK